VRTEPDVQAVVVAIRALWQEGCPVASRAEEMAAVALRRWRSSSRRGIKAEDGPGRVRDLAKGLAARFEQGPSQLGALMRDYECVAERVAQVLPGAAVGQGAAKRA
jgi:hypothetical protein